MALRLKKIHNSVCHRSMCGRIKSQFVPQWHNVQCIMLLAQFQLFVYHLVSPSMFALSVYSVPYSTLSFWQQTPFQSTNATGAFMKYSGFISRVFENFFPSFSVRLRGGEKVLEVAPCANQSAKCICYVLVYILNKCEMLMTHSRSRW